MLWWIRKRIYRFFRWHLAKRDEGDIQVKCPDQENGMPMVVRVRFRATATPCPICSDMIRLPVKDGRWERVSVESIR